VVVKASDLHYLPDKRVMLKVKHQRTADCVVAGFRTHKDGAGVGSMLLGLYDPEGTLHHVGVTSGFSVARRPGARSDEPVERGQGHDMGTAPA
jgi:ATP-dependent DNA ligase